MTSWSTTQPEYLDMHEVPPAGSGKIKDYDNSDLLTKIRYWLLRKLAGKRAIMINVRVGVIPRLDDRNVVGRTTRTGAGLLMHGSYVYCDDDRMLLLSNNAD